MHALQEVSGEEVLRDVHALELLHGLKLLLSLLSGVLEGLVLLLDAADLSFDFVLPIGVLKLPPLVIFIFELSNFFKLMLLLHFQDCLVYRLVKQDVQDRLDLDIIVEEVIVLDLRYLVDSRLFRNVFRSWRFRLENVSLQFHFCLIGFSLTLFSQKVGQVYLDPSWRPWSQIIRRCGVFGLFKFHQLRFYHLDFLLLSLLFDSLLLLLGRVQILLQDVLVVSVSSEDSLIIHDVESLAPFFFLWDRRVKHTVFGSTVLVLVFNNCGRGSFK